MNPPSEQVNFRISLAEKETLTQFCEQEQRGQSEVLRELIRGLRRKIKTPSNGYVASGGESDD